MQCPTRDHGFHTLFYFRWASPETARHYLNVADSTLLRIGRQLTRATMKRTVDEPLADVVVPVSRAQLAAAVVTNASVSLKRPLVEPVPAPPAKRVVIIPSFQSDNSRVFALPNPLYANVLHVSKHRV